VRSWVARVIATVGAALVVAAAMASQAWLDRHFLPSFFMPRSWYVAIESVVRLTVAAIGMTLFATRLTLARLLTGSPSMTLRVVVAAAMAVGAGEFAMSAIRVRPTEWLLPGEEPRRQPDARLGWVLAPARTGHRSVGGRLIDYAVDAQGYRVGRADDAVDRGRPTLIFAGESVMFGEGLTWEESIPAQAGAMLDLQAANLAVHGYSTDQIYLRLAEELPRFRQPIAVVSIFMPELFGRNLDEDRPYLARGLVWRPARQASHLAALAGLLVPYRRIETVEKGVDVTREVLGAITALARDRGATSLLVVPQFGTEDPVLRSLRERIVPLDVPSLLVPLDPHWRLQWDRHPNARSAHVIAAAVAARLRVR